MRSHTNTANKVPGLQLHRVIRLGDKTNNQVFTFIVPSQLTKGFLQSVQSKEFHYGGHRWFIRMEYYTEPNECGSGKEDPHFIQYRKQPLGVSIHLCSISSGMTCRLKSVKFTIPHQECYMQNLIHESEDVHFRCSSVSYKVSKWIESGLLTNEHYLFDDSTCILEVELQEFVTTYEELLRVPRDSKEAVRCRSLESTTFPFAGDDWSFIVDWNTPQDKSRGHNKDDSRPKFYIQRHSSPKHWTRLKYELAVSWHDYGTSRLGPFDQLINPESGATTKAYTFGDSKWFSNSSTPVITSKHRISVKIDFHSVVHISRVDLIPTAPQGGRNCARVVDPSGVDWIIMSDILGTYVRLKLFLPNESNTKHNDNESNMAVRSTAWSVQLIPYESSLNIVKSMSSFYVIYTPINISGQITTANSTKPSPCQEVVLPLDVEKVCSSNFGYSRPEDNAITLRIEWLYSHVLSRGDYHNYDELVAMQRYNLIKDMHLKVAEIDRLTKQKAVQFSRASRDCEIYGEKLSEPNSVYTKQVYPTRCSSDIISPNRLSFRESPRIKQLPTPRATSPNSPTNNGTSRTNSPTIKNYLTPPVIINGSVDSNTNSDTGNLDFTDESLSSNPYWRRHSSCLEDVGSSKPRHRRQLPSPPSSSASSSRLVLPGGIPSVPTNDYSISTRPNSANSPRLSLKHTNFEFGYSN
uniref:MATH domain-containing protein n=1 Tax=Trichobilharzia regenti TaxID=157069 RepID=A0AA85JUA2_TRIRE|nr:unnamed protein product [Trichobilharzia regenti]